MARGGEGITSQDEWNSFGGWNLVFAAYCSSDQWSGTKGEHVFEGDPPYRLFFEGAVVAADGIAAAVAGMHSDDGTVELPSLADAGTVVVAGVSAGTHGAALHRGAIAAAAPLAEVVTVLDSTFYASPEVMTPDLDEAFETQLSRIWNDTALPAWGSVVHESCALEHATDPWRCLSMDTMMREGHVEGNVLWIHDLRDDVIYDYYASIGVSEGLYQQLGVDTARLFEDEVPLVSVYGYSCGIHTTIDANGTFSNYNVVDAENGGPALTIHDALLSVLDGARVVAVDSAPPANSICY
jgi:hypothetical protein